MILRDKIAPYLPRVLASLEVPVDTRGLVDKLARVMQVSDTLEKQRISRVLCDMAANGYPGAQHSEVTFVRYGRPMRRWIWSPSENETALSSQGLEDLL